MPAFKQMDNKGINTWNTFFARTFHNIAGKLRFVTFPFRLWYASLGVNSKPLDMSLALCLRYALDNIPKGKAEEVYAMLTAFEKVCNATSSSLSLSLSLSPSPFLNTGEGKNSAGKNSCEKNTVPNRGQYFSAFLRIGTEVFPILLRIVELY